MFWVQDYIWELEYECPNRAECRDRTPYTHLPTRPNETYFRYTTPNIIEVLKKKYLDGVLDKFKARWVYDGRRQKSVNAASSTPLDTFAPTVRHSTHKLLVAHSALNGASSTTLHSRAYIERIAAELLPRPVASYGPRSTPCSADILKKYEVWVHLLTKRPRFSTRPPRDGGRARLSSRQWMRASGRR